MEIDKQIKFIETFILQLELAANKIASQNPNKATENVRYAGVLKEICKTLEMVRDSPDKELYEQILAMDDKDGAIYTLTQANKEMAADMQSVRIMYNKLIHLQKKFKVNYGETAG